MKFSVSFPASSPYERVETRGKGIDDDFPALTRPARLRFTRRSGLEPPAGAWPRRCKEKLFSRTRAAIGRKVQNCHPQKGAHLVSQILDDFKKGVKDSFEFWFNVGPRKAYVRYFAVRDESEKYLGCIGVDQDITYVRNYRAKNGSSTHCGDTRSRARCGSDMSLLART